MTYLLLSVAFLAVAFATAITAVFLIPRQHRLEQLRRWRLPIAATAVALIVLTAIFDNIMIALGFMTYSDTHTTGLEIGLAPMEDFSYPLAALVILPALWVILARQGKEQTSE